MINIFNIIKRKVKNFFINLIYLNPIETGKKLGIMHIATKKVTANYIGIKVVGNVVSKQKSPYTGEKYATIELDPPKKIMGTWRWHVVVKENEIIKYMNDGV
jgi:hypothetical protein